MKIEYGLDAYFNWADEYANRTRRAIMGALLVMALMGCASNPVHRRAEASSDERIVSSPIAAINVSQCDGSVALYVVIDPTHMMRFDQKQTTIFTTDHGKVTETLGPPTPYEKAVDLASTATLTSHADVKCDGVGI